MYFETINTVPTNSFSFIIFLNVTTFPPSILSPSAPGDAGTFKV